MSCVRQRLDGISRRISRHSNHITAFYGHIAVITEDKVLSVFSRIGRIKAVGIFHPDHGGMGRRFCQINIPFAVFGLFHNIVIAPHILILERICL